MPTITMLWWKSERSGSHSSLSPPSSASPSSSPVSKQRRRGGSCDPSFLSRQQEAAAHQPRLTRQRKLRHLTDEEVVGLGGFVDEKREEALPLPADAPSPVVVHSPGDRECGPSCSGSKARLGPFSVVPVPLPLPESDSNHGYCRLPLPEEAARAAAWEDGNVPGMLVSNGHSPKARTKSSPSRSRIASQFIRRGREQVGAFSSGSTVRHGMYMFPGYNAIDNLQSLRLNFPARSAPNTRLPSPVQSPRRLSTSDFLPSPHADSQGLRFLFTSENRYSDTTTSGFSSQTSPEKFGGMSPDWSPLHSPTSKNSALRLSNSSVPTTPLHPKITADSASWHDGLVTVHPLPLPPGASSPSKPTFGHQDPITPEVTYLKNHWQKGKLIGSGSFGNVYVARNKETGASCAMKEVNLIPDDPKSAECMKQLAQEIKVLSQLKHQNIVQYYGSEIVEDRFYIYLEYVHPGSISKYTREHGSMTESMVSNFTRHILSGLAYLHSANIIHRDIKGANLLVDTSGVVKLADFGMAKHMSGQDNILSLKGTPFWMAPEVVQAMMKKDGGYDLAIDIWSLGCTIIEMFTGKPPWIGIGAAPAMFKLLHNESPPVPDKLSAEGKEFLQLCFRRNPAERPSASKLLEHPFVRNPSSTHDPRLHIGDISNET